MDTKIIVGGEEIAVPALNFRRLRLVYPALTDLGAADGLIDQVLAAIRIFTGALGDARADLTADVFEDRLSAAEAKALIGSVTDLMVESGVYQRPGEPQPAVAGGSTATSPS